MNRARHHRRTIQWARYANRYAHHPMACIGGWPLYKAMHVGGYGRPWKAVRRQSKHRRRWA